MRSMFWRLFISFWLTMILGGAMSIVVISTFRHLSVERLHDDMARRMDGNITNLIVVSGQTALQVYRCGGGSEYHTFLERLKGGAGIVVNVVGADNRSISGEPLPEAIGRLAERARSEGATVVDKDGGRFAVAKLLPEGGGGDPSVVVGEHVFDPLASIEPPGRGRNLNTPPPMGPPGGSWRPPPLPRFFPPFFGPGELIRTAVMLLLVSAVCYFLAKSIATPLRRLQRTAQQIGAGDFSARVGTNLGRPGNEIADLGRDFDIMAERTEAVINAQKRLLRDISHELRSPLARLNVALELTKKRFVVENDPTLDKIGQEADRLNELIGQLLVLSRLESGAGLPVSEPVDLTSIVLAVAADCNFEATLSGRGVRVVTAAVATVAGSRELLRRAVENIVRNGARYTAVGTQVEIVLEVQDNIALICIRDYGPGVPESDLPSLFLPFYRVAAARERKTGGTGIGLAIAMQAIKAHGGTMVIKNVGNHQGLEVSISLPIAGKN